MPGYDRIISPEGNAAPEKEHPKTHAGKTQLHNTTTEHCYFKSYVFVVPEVLFVLIKYHQRLSRSVDLHYEFHTDPV